MTMSFSLVRRIDYSILYSYYILYIPERSITTNGSGILLLPLGTFESQSGSQIERSVSLSDGLGCITMSSLIQKNSPIYFKGNLSIPTVSLDHSLQLLLHLERSLSSNYFIFARFVTTLLTNSDHHHEASQVDNSQNFMKVSKLRSCTS